MNLSKYTDIKFEYGTHDCFLFVCDIVKNMTGKDYASKYRYKNEFGALRLIKKLGGFDRAMIKIFGELHPPWSAVYGSPVLVGRAITEQDSVGAALGIFDGSQVVCLSDDGLIDVPVLACRGCWYV